MRIAFLGKGGSGKTSVSSAYIRFIASRQPVLAIDADLNVHLAAALDLPESPAMLGERFEQISDYLKGSRQDLRGRALIGATPPALGSKLVAPSFDDPLIAQLASRRGNITLLTVGTYAEDDIGSTCYHGKLSSLALLLHHMVDGPDDRIVADATAGIDNLATSLSFAYDLNVFVVEPTLKSVRVFQDFYARAASLKIPVAVIGNKISSRGDEEFLRSQIQSEHILGMLPLSEELRRFEQGDSSGLDGFVATHSNLFEMIDDRLRSIPKDWDRYLAFLHSTYRRVCDDWYTPYFKTDMATGIDTQFRYPEQRE